MGMGRVRQNRRQRPESSKYEPHDCFLLQKDVLSMYHIIGPREARRDDGLRAAIPVVPNIVDLPDFAPQEET